MAWNGSRRAALLSFMACAIVLAMASAAVACTKYVGKVTVAASGPLASGSATAEGGGGDTGEHAYCVPQTRQDLTNVGLFTVTVAPPSASCGGGPGLDGSKEWVARWIMADVANPEVSNCNSVIPTRHVQGVLGPIDIDGNGNGFGIFELPPKIGPVNICVWSPQDTRTSAPQVYVNLV